MKSVYIYDFESARWSRGADRPTPRSFFVCSVSSSNGLVYVAAGIDRSLNPLSAAETYNVEEDKWDILPPMIQPHGPSCHSVFMEGKFMVLTTRNGHRMNGRVEVFNPSAGTWEFMPNFKYNVWNSRGVASSSGNLYAFTERHVMKCDRENNVWTHVASLPLQNYFITFVTEWQDCIFVSTYVFASKKHIPYLFNPSTGGWIEANCDEEGFVGMVVSATTFQI